MQPHHIFSHGITSLDDNFLDVGTGTGDAIPGQRLLFLALRHAVRQEVKLDCNTAHAFLDLPTSGRVQTVTRGGKKTSVIVLCVYLCTLLCKVGRGLQVCVMRSEVVLDILQVTNVLQFWHPCTQHLQNTTRQQLQFLFTLRELLP